MKDNKFSGITQPEKIQAVLDILKNQASMKKVTGKHHNFKQAELQALQKLHKNFESFKKKSKNIPPAVINTALARSLKNADIDQDKFNYVLNSQITENKNSKKSPNKLNWKKCFKFSKIEVFRKPQLNIKKPTMSWISKFKNAFKSFGRK